ncbi:WecB/TagA/CpsF family glycosyltransferase [Pseudomonas sp. GCM10022188]|uniref:WecB/TagA/CpsF family glycosyltransferase n=1 Tax=Pseudomonas TaxID=286 RepID=UPI001E414A6B|nr:WecB/TagA/CpsF family glycosyltransferase [Pseudomonas oryzagri]MCC6076897.1 WecB/TagA/CpsF family glycosyltransferase [Pseudomonas oryzagri]
MEKSILDLKILDIPISEFISKIKTDLNQIATPRIIVTPNIDHLQRLSSANNDLFNTAYRNADYIVCDSRVLKIASCLKGTHIKNVIPGSDLTKAIIQDPWIKDKKICIIGPSYNEYKILKEIFSLELACHYCPPIGFMEDPFEVEKCISLINQETPDLVFLAVGSPRQEALALKIKQRVTTPMLLFCIGASLDFLSGKTPRAPKWMQTAHLEWFHRMLSEPKRLAPRYIKNAKWLINYLTLKNN